MKKKILSIFMIVLLVTSLVAVPVFADAKDVLSNITGEGTGDNSALIEKGNNFLSIVQTVGVIVAVIMLVILGIRYVAAPVGEKAEVKKNLLPYVIGVLFIFSAVGIITLISSLNLI